MISRTDQTLHEIQEFLSNFNEIFTKYKQKTFILGDVDYSFVAEREAQEIYEAFQSFGLLLKTLT